MRNEREVSQSSSARTDAALPSARTVMADKPGWRKHVVGEKFLDHVPDAPPLKSIGGSSNAVFLACPPASNVSAKTKTRLGCLMRESRWSGREPIEKLQPGVFRGLR